MTLNNKILTRKICLALLFERNRHPSWCEHPLQAKLIFSLVTLQIYQRFDADSIANIDDARLEYFSKKVFSILYKL